MADLAPVTVEFVEEQIVGTVLDATLAAAGVQPEPEHRAAVLASMRRLCANVSADYNVRIALADRYRDYRPRYARPAWD